MYMNVLLLGNLRSVVFVISYFCVGEVMSGIKLGNEYYIFNSSNLFKPES